jgi:DNA-binding transcriptional ArsR family regulator
VSQLKLTPELIGLIADRFKALSEPARLQILNTLRGGEKTVNELVDATGLGQANVSKHLQSLFAAGFVRRRKEGLFTYYALADRTVFRLCDIMCGRLEQELASHRKVLAGRG